MKKKGFTIWFTGLSGSGKTTVSQRVAEMLDERGVQSEILDGDIIRENLSKGLGFSKEDRDTNIKRIAFVCKLLTRQGAACIAAAISPYRETREYARNEIKNFVEVYVNSPIDVCIERDVKGLYKKAIAGEIQNFTGISDPYEPPVNPEAVCCTDRETVDESAAKVLRVLEQLGYLEPA